MMKKYLVQAFLIAIMAVHLTVLYDTLEKGKITVWYSGILMLHTPVWLTILILGEILIKFKINYRLFIISSGSIMFLQLIAAYQKFQINFDLLALYNVVDYIFCFSLFAYWRTKIEQEKQVEN